MSDFDVAIKKTSRGELVFALESGGANFKGNSCTCPFHEDKHASAGIYQDNEGYWKFKCQVPTCGIHGDIFDVQAKIEGKSSSDLFGDTVKIGKEVVQPAKSVVQKVFIDIQDVRKSLNGSIEDEYEYMNSDGKTAFVVFRHKTSSGKAFKPAKPVENGWVMQAPDKPWPIYNLKNVKGSQTVIVVEGEKCADALNGLGFCATTSPFGAGKSQYSDWSELSGKTVILWPDNDTPGHLHMKQVHEILMSLPDKPKVSVVNPSVCSAEVAEDVADYIQKLESVGCEEIVEEIGRVISSAERKSVGIERLLDDTISGKRENMPLPFERISKLAVPLLPETITLICGDGGATKSFFLMQCLLFWMGRGIKFGCYMLEESREYHQLRALAQIESNGELTDDEWVRANPIETRAAYDRHKGVLEELSKQIWATPTKQVTLDELSLWVLERAKSGCRIIAIDPVTAAESGQKPWIADAKFICEVKKICVDYQCSVVLITHPKKGKGGMGLDDLSGGAAYSRFSQTILWLEFHKVPRTEKIKMSCGSMEEQFNRTVHICKARNGKGTGYAVGLNFHSHSLTFDELGVIMKK